MATPGLSLHMSKALFTGDVAALNWSPDTQNESRKQLNFDDADENDTVNAKDSSILYDADALNNTQEPLPPIIPNQICINKEVDDDFMSSVSFSDSSCSQCVDNCFSDDNFDVISEYRVSGPSFQVNSESEDIDNESYFMRLHAHTPMPPTRFCSKK
jgi:hypothetical protein